MSVSCKYKIKKMPKVGFNSINEGICTNLNIDKQDY